MAFELSLFTARGYWGVLTTNPETGELETVGLNGTGRLTPRFSSEQALSLVNDQSVPEALLFDSIPFQLIDGEMRRPRKLPTDDLPEFVEAPTAAGLPLEDGFRYDIEFDALTAYGRTHRLKSYLFNAPTSGGEHFIPGFAPVPNTPAKGIVSPIDDIQRVATSIAFYFQGQQIGPLIPLPVVEGASTWDDVQDKPTTFPPTPHGHVVADLTDATSVGKALAKAVDAAAARGAISAVTAAEVTTMVNSAVSSLVADAPGALDNFAELATALGNNPNFATDILQAVSLRALDSAVVHNTGNETVAGTKNFTTAPTVNGQAVVTTNDNRLTNARPPTAHGHQISDITSLQAALDAKAAKYTGTPDGTRFLSDDGTYKPPPSSGGGGGNDPRIGVAATYLGNGTNGPFTWNHGQGSRDVLGLSVRDVITGQQIIVDNYVAGPNSLRFEPAVVWANDRIRVSATFGLLSGDAQSPTGLTVTENSKTSSTISVTATGATDNVAVTLYRWWLNGVLVAETTSSSYTYTGLNGAQEYIVGITALDKAYNESAMATKSITTSVPANVAFESAGAGARNTTGNGTAQWAHTVPAGLSNAALLVPVVVSHSGWFDLAANNYSGAGISSSLDGAGFTRAGSGFAAAAIGFGTQIEAGVEIWYKLNPTPGAHTISAQRTPGSAQSTSVIANSFLYSGVGAVEGYQTAEWDSGSDTITSLLAAASSVTDMLFFAAGGTNPFAGFNRTARSTPAGGAVTGMGDYALFGDAVGAAGTVQFQDTATKIWGAAKVRLRKAGT